MKKYPKVSCLILNWNGLTFTQKCLRSLLKTNYPNIEIILLDNGSANNEAEKIKKQFGKKILVIENALNEGYAVGMNKAFRLAKGKYVMLLNNDMEFDKNWLIPLVNQLEEDDTIGACQPKVKDMVRTKYFEYAAGAGGFIDILGYPFARGRIFSTLEKDNGQYEDSISVGWAGIFLTRKKILDKIGLFDPIYFNYAEDVDFSIKLYNAGYKIIYVPTSIVYHYGGGVLGKNLERRMFFLHRNHIILVLKNWSFSLLCLLLIPRLLMDIASFFYYIKTGYQPAAKGLIKSYISLIPMFPKVIMARMRTKKKLSLQITMPLYKGSIAWDYFIRKKKTFNKIIKNMDLASIEQNARIFGRAQVLNANRKTKDLQKFFHNNESLLDYGCGDLSLANALKERIPSMEITGIDVVDFKKKPKGIKFKKYAGDKIPFQSKTFDSVLAYQVFHHCEDIEKAFSECFRVAKKRVIIVEPIYRFKLEIPGMKFMDWFWNAWKGEPINLPYRFCSIQEWKKICKKYKARMISLEEIDKFIPRWLPIGRTYIFVVEKA